MEILVIHTGGTVSCQNEGGVLVPKKDIAPVFKEISKELFKKSDVRFVHRRIKPFLSENLNGAILTKIANEVRAGIQSCRYHGVIVTHGSDTIAYTSALLAYIFGNDCIPTVTVCADLPLDDPRSSGHVNLRAAAVLAASEERGVFSVYRDSDTSAVIHRGSRILRHRTYENELSSVSYPYGKVLLIAPENPKIVKDPRFSESEDGIIFEPEALKKTSDIMLFNCYPGAVFPTPTRTCKAVILGSYHSGTLCTDSAELKKFARLCKKRDIPVFVDGVGLGSDYESMEAYSSLGITRLPPLSSPAAMYIKLWLIISNGERELAEMLYRPCGSDLPPTR